MKLMRTLRLSALGALALTAFLQAAPSAPVADAAMAGNKDAVRALLKQAADVNAAQGDGMTALHWAAMKDDAELVQTLLFAGANVRATTRIGSYTPLILAAKSGSSSAIAPLAQVGRRRQQRHGQRHDRADARRGVREHRRGEAARRRRRQRQREGAGARADAGDVRRGVEPRRGDRAARGQRRRPQGDVESDRPRGAQQDPAALRDITFGNPAPPGEPPAGGRNGPAPQAQGGRGGRGGGTAGVDRNYQLNELVAAQGGLTPLLLAAREGHIDSVRALLDAGADVNQVERRRQDQPAADCDHQRPLRSREAAARQGRRCRSGGARTTRRRCTRR